MDDRPGIVRAESRMIRLDPDGLGTYGIRAAALAEDRDYAPALADFGAALALDPSDAEARDGRGRAQAALAMPRRVMAPRCVDGHSLDEVNADRDAGP